MIVYTLTASNREYGEYIQIRKQLAAEAKRILQIHAGLPRWRPALIRKVSKARHLLRYYPVGFE